MEEISIYRLFAEIDDPDTMKRFFEEIFTPSERHDLMMRWKLMQMLDQGIPQRKIASELGVSLCKITRGSKIVQDPNSVSVSLLKKHR